MWSLDTLAAQTHNVICYTSIAGWLQVGRVPVQVSDSTHDLSGHQTCHAWVLLGIRCTHLLASIPIERQVCFSMSSGNLHQLHLWTYFACLITTHSSADSHITVYIEVFRAQLYDYSLQMPLTPSVLLLTA